MKIKDQVGEIFDEYPAGGLALVVVSMFFGAVIVGILQAF